MTEGLFKGVGYSVGNLIGGSLSSVSLPDFQLLSNATVSYAASCAAFSTPPTSWTGTIASKTFRALKSNEIRLFGEYCTSRLVLVAWDQQQVVHKA